MADDFSPADSLAKLRADIDQAAAVAPELAKIMRLPELPTPEEFERLTIDQQRYVMDQRLAALDLANDVRIGVATLRREIAALDLADGCAHVADLIEHDDATIAAARVGRILTSIQRVGTAKSGRLLSRADIRSRDLHFRDLTARQRRLLILELRRNATFAGRARQVKARRGHA